MKRITIQDKSVAYSSKGKGFPVVLLHGFCEDSRIWEEFKTDLLEEKYRVVTIDLPGFGQSELTDEKLTIADMAEVVHTVIDHLNLDKLVLIGHSMGGYVSLAFAEQYPDKLMGLGLFHSQPYADTAAKKAHRQKSIDFIKRQGHILYVKQLFPNLFAPSFISSNTFLLEKLSFRAAAYPSAGIVNALQAMKNRPDRSQVLRDIAVPVLFIIGGQDQVIDHKKSMQQTALPAVASVHLLEKVGHMGMLEARKQTQLLVRRFVEFCLDE